MILESIGLIICLSVRSRLSRYVSVFFGLNLLSQMYSTGIMHLVSKGVINGSDSAFIGSLINIPTLLLAVAAYGVLILAVLKMK